MFITVFLLEITADDGSDCKIGVFSTLQRALDEIPAAFRLGEGEPAGDFEMERSFITEYEIDGDEVAFYNGYGKKVS